MPWTEAEANEIARVFAEMFQATPGDVRDSTKQVVLDLRGRVPALNNQPNPATIRAVCTAVAQEFRADPSLASEVFDALEWPSPFPLVQKDERSEIHPRRAAGSAFKRYRAPEVAGAIVAMVREAPENGPDSRTNVLRKLSTFVPTMTADEAGEEMIAQLLRAFVRDPDTPDRICAAYHFCPDFSRSLRTKLAEIADGGALFGLALSGGGIRSATFCLGVLQRLAEEGHLEGVDILSTVSGGGYIGAWLAAWTKRSHDLGRVCDWLSPEKHPDPNVEEVRPIRMLRR